MLLQVHNVKKIKTFEETESAINMSNECTSKKINDEVKINYEDEDLLRPK